MVEGIHSHVAETFVCGITVPSFPNGGGSVYSAVPPSGIFAAAQNFIRQLRFAQVTYRRHQEFYA